MPAIPSTAAQGFEGVFCCRGGAVLPCRHRPTSPPPNRSLAAFCAEAGGIPEGDEYLVQVRASDPGDVVEYGPSTFRLLTHTHTHTHSYATTHTRMSAIHSQPVAMGRPQVYAPPLRPGDLGAAAPHLPTQRRCVRCFNKRGRGVTESESLDTGCAFHWPKIALALAHTPALPCMLLLLPC